MQRNRPIPDLFLPSSGRSAGGRKAHRTGEANPALQAIWDTVCRIPQGRVSTYGAVAQSAGLPGRARQAGFALRVAPEAMNIPWHRVVGAGGRIVFPRTSRHFREQSRRLRGEGVAVRDGRVQAFAIMAAGEW